VAEPTDPAKQGPTHQTLWLEENAALLLAVAGVVVLVLGIIAVFLDKSEPALIWCGTLLGVAAVFGRRLRKLGFADASVELDAARDTAAKAAQQAAASTPAAVIPASTEGFGLAQGLMGQPLYTQAFVDNLVTAYGSNTPATAWQAARELQQQVAMGTAVVRVSDDPTDAVTR